MGTRTSFWIGGAWVSCGRSEEAARKRRIAERRRVMLVLRSGKRKGAASRSGETAPWMNVGPSCRDGEDRRGRARVGVRGRGRGRGRPRDAADGNRGSAGRRRGRPAGGRPQGPERPERVRWRRRGGAGGPAPSPG